MRSFFDERLVRPARCDAITRYAMPSFTISDLDDETVRQLRRRAALNGRSEGEEAHAILSAALQTCEPALDLASAIRARILPSARAEIPLPRRDLPVAHDPPES